MVTKCMFTDIKIPNPLQIWQTHTDRELIKQKLTRADVF